MEELRARTEGVKQLVDNLDNIESIAYDTFLQALLRMGNDEATAYFYKEFSKREVNGNINYYTLTKIEDLFGQVYNLHNTVKHLDVELLQKAEDALEYIEGFHTGDRLVSAYLAFRKAEFKYYCGYVGRSALERYRYFSEAIDLHQEVLPKMGITLPQCEDCEKIPAIPNNADRKLAVYLANTVGDACSKIIELTDFIAPEYWWDGTELDSLFIDAMAKPQGIILEMEKEIGRYAGGLDLTDGGDAQRGKAALWMLKNKLAHAEQPFFMSAYFASFDESAHVNGVYSREAANSLEKIDAMLGELFHAAEEIAGEDLVICVVSDHGTLDNTHNISPNVLLHKAGLIEADEKGNVKNWKAFSQRAGGTAEIRLADPDDKEAADALAKVMEQLKEDKESGILEVLTGEEARARGGFHQAAYVLVSQKGYELRDDVVGDYCRTRLTQKAQHGYSEEFPEMRASFMLHGKGIQKANIENVRLIDVAPTLAGIMGFELPDAEGRNILE